MKLYQPLIFLFYGHAFGQITLNCRVNPHSNGGFCVTGKDGQSPAGHQIQYNHNNGTLSPKLTVKTDFKDCFNFEYSINPLTDQKNFGWERLDTNLLQDGDRTSVVAYTHKAFKKTVCNAEHQCGKHEQTYNWCYTKAKWQYCSVSSATTASDALCKNGCTSNGENYECDCDDCSASWKRRCSPPGNPPSCYVNGSRINFSVGTVDFLAVETPKQNMLSSFWELVVEQSPKVVVMFGDAEDRHWPDRDNPIMEMDNMIWLTLRGNTIHQHFVHRQIDITDRYGREKTIDHLHCSNWKTGTIPSITQLLLSMVYKAQEILKESTEDTPDRILVESKTGSGRAGTFIAVYQSIEELNDGTISTIDPFLTVVEMRRGRERMVETSLQFHHVVQCVSDHVVHNGT